MSYLVLDIETVPDLTAWQPPQLSTEANGETTKPDIAPKSRSRKKPAKAPEDYFAPLFAHRPIAVGYVLLDDNLALQGIGCAGTSTFGNNEQALLKGAHDFIQSTGGTVVTWNGRGFDLPVLALRAFKFGVPATWYTKDHRYRYSETQHLDLFQAMTEMGAIQAITGFTLDTFCQLMGLPGKNGVDASKVRGLFERGDIATIEGYCTCDVARTAFVLMRYLLMRGRINIDHYRAVAGALFQHCVQLNLGGVIFGADPKQLLLEA